jgi:hypothetical protein
MVEKVAVEVKVLQTGNIDQRLYKLIPPYGSHEYVIVSASRLSRISVYVPDETYIFPSNESGEIVEYIELNGSYRGGLSHSQALEGAGYIIVHYL